MATHSHMPPDIPNKAFILAAGHGTRLRPYTDNIPKPMVEIGGQSLIRRIIEQLAEISVRDIVINTHYKADTLQDHLKGIESPKLHILHEDTLLDTGGGIKAGLEHFGQDEPFFAINGDSYLINPPKSSVLQTLAQHWNPETMDILLLLEPVAQMQLTKGTGDYDIDAQGRCIRSRDKSGAYMFSSVRIHHPRIFAGTPDTAFSYLDLMDRAQEQGRLYGLPNPGIWHHISTPDDLLAVRQSLETDTQTARP